MIRYFGISIGMHVAALAAVFSVATLPRTDVLQSEAGDTVVLTFHGSASPNRQVVESLREPTPEKSEAVPRRQQPREPTIEPETVRSSSRLNLPQETPLTVEAVAPEPEQEKNAEAKDRVLPQAVEKVAERKPLSPPASAPAASGGHTVPARNVRCPAPPFPESARRFRVEGQVRVQVHISDAGRVAEVDIIESSGRSDFDRAARATILKHWRYEPARKWGQPVTSRETVLVEFRLQR